MENSGEYITRWLEADKREPSSFAGGHKITSREWCYFEQARLVKKGKYTGVEERSTPSGTVMVALKLKSRE